MAGGGVLVVVGTPIGNLGDLSPRAAEELGRADAVCCEDTRRTGRLLKHIGVHAPKLLTVNDHTEARAVDEIVRRVAAGERVALVSDAGMPGISDPGEQVVAAVVGAGLALEVVPGPSAVVTALVVSGLPAGRFAYEGFLPRKGSGRTERLAAVAAEPSTVVLYEAPHRVVRTVADLAAACGGDRPVALARELTKLHEEVWRGTLDGAATHLAERAPLGEFVIVLGGAPPAAEVTDEQVVAEARAALASGLSARDAAADVAAALGIPKRRAYAAVTALATKPTGSGAGAGSAP